MNKKLFLNNDRYLIQYEKNTFSKSNNVIMTDLLNVQQTKLNLRDYINTMKFIIQNMNEQSNDKTLQYIDDIEKICQLKRIILLKEKLSSILSQFDLLLTNKEEDRLLKVCENDKNQELYSETFSIYNSILSKLNNLELDTEDRKYLENNGIVFNNNCLAIDSHTNSSAVKCKVLGSEKCFIYFENTCFERKQYLEKHYA